MIGSTLRPLRILKPDENEETTVPEKSESRGP